MCSGTSRRRRHNIILLYGSTIRIPETDRQRCHYTTMQRAIYETRDDARETVRRSDADGNRRFSNRQTHNIRY